jgi:hypothetical protein
MCQRRWVQAHERAVASAVSYLEREACRTRRGRGGMERVSGEGFVAAAYRRRLSRAGDPQLHTHVVVANLTRADGRFTALDAHTLYEHKSASGAVYRAALRTEVRERLPWASWQRVGRALFEIDGVRRAGRRRRGGVAVPRADAGDRPRHSTPEEPRHHRWRAVARRGPGRSAEHGFGPRELAQLRARRPTDSVRGSGRLHAISPKRPDTTAWQPGLTAVGRWFARQLRRPRTRLAVIGVVLLLVATQEPAPAVRIPTLAELDDPDVIEGEGDTVEIDVAELKALIAAAEAKEADEARAQTPASGDGQPAASDDPAAPSVESPAQRNRPAA